MNFAVYTKDNCPYCEKIKQVMDLTKLSYVVYNLNEHFDKKSFIMNLVKDQLSHEVVVDGKKLGGCVDTIEFLRENKIAK